MKKVLFLSAFMLAFISAHAQDVNFSISGVSSDNGSKVILIDLEEMKILSTTEVDNGKFAFTGSAKKDLLMGIKGEKTNWITNMINDGTPVTINMADYTLKGSAQNERLVRYDLDMNYEYSSEKAKPILEKIFTDELQTLIPLAFIGQYIEEFGSEKMRKIIESTPTLAASQFANITFARYKMEEEENAKKNAFIGKQFTDIEEADVDGNVHKLSEYVGKDKWVLVDLWASWCGPCRAEMPNVVAAYEKYHAKGFDIVGLSFDNKKEPWVKAIADLKMPWTHLSDLKGWHTAAADVYSVNSIPDNLLISPEGKIVARGLRAQGLHDKLKEIFGE